MSRLVLRSRLVALVLLGAVSVSVPALADVAPRRSSNPCLQQWSARHLRACRFAVRHARRPVLRTIYRGPQPILFGDYVSAVPRYASLVMIIGVGF